MYSIGTPWARRALEGVDLDVAAGEGLLVVGPNGSGKSTLAWIIAGLTAPSEGVATLDDGPIHEAGTRVAISFQHARLQLFRATVAEDLAYGGGANSQQTEAALRVVGLDPAELLDKRVDELSGGQQRRVVLAGLIARTPLALVLDEPFAGLDADGRAALVATMGRLRSNGVALVVVSHDYEGADQYAERVVGLRAGRVAFDEPLGRALSSGDLATLLDEPPLVEGEAAR